MTLKLRVFDDLPGVTCEVVRPAVEGESWYAEVGPDCYVRVIQRFSDGTPLDRRKLGGHLVVPAEVVDDLDPRELESAVEAALDRLFRPWRYADPCPYPHLDLFPRTTAAWRRLRNPR